MAALSAQSARRLAEGGFSWHQRWPIANSVTVYIGSFCGIPGGSALTSTRGYARPWTNEQTIQWIGPAIGFLNAVNPQDQRSGSLAGDTSASPLPSVITEAGPCVIENYSVTGVSAQSDVRLPVYASNDNDLTTTANQAPIVGRIVYYRTSTNCDVLFYGYLASVVI